MYDIYLTSGHHRFAFSGWLKQASGRVDIWRKAVIMWRQTITQAEQHLIAPLNFTLYMFYTFNLFITLLKTHCK